MTINIEGEGKITATKDVLVTIVGAFWDACNENDRNGFHATANRQRQIGKSIYDALANTGYFDE